MFAGALGGFAGPVEMVIGRIGCSQNVAVRAPERRLVRGGRLRPMMHGGGKHPGRADCLARGPSNRPPIWR